MSYLDSEDLEEARLNPRVNISGLGAEELFPFTKFDIKKEESIELCHQSHWKRPVKQGMKKTILQSGKQIFQSQTSTRNILGNRHSITVVMIQEKLKTFMKHIVRRALSSAWNAQQHRWLLGKNDDGRRMRRRAARGTSQMNNNNCTALHLLFPRADSDPPPTSESS